METLFLMLIGNSVGVTIANFLSVLLFLMLGVLVIEFLYLPERIRNELNNNTQIMSMAIPNDLIFIGYIFFCVCTLILV